MNKSFEEYATNYKPFPWEVDNDTPQLDIRGKNSLIVNFCRYKKIAEYISLVSSGGNINEIVDFGAYPGSWLKIVREYFGFNGSYHAIGLGFSDHFRHLMEGYGAQLHEVELDVEFRYSKKTPSLNIMGSGLCLFLDTIEHLVNPINALDEINKCLVVGGKLIVTTDNVTAFGYLAHMLFRGESPNVHPIRSSLFYSGPWRPHHREFSKNELEFYLSYCGFKILKHEYFERQQGDYYVDSDKAKLCKVSRYRSLKGALKKLSTLLIPHLRDHQIILAVKTTDYKDVANTRIQATESMQEFLALRSKYGL